MKLKTPLFLALIVGSILIIIFLIYPKIQEINSQSKILKEKEILVNSIKEKNDNISALAKILADSQNKDQTDFVLNYIPFEKKEEQIFNSINNIANAENVKVAIANISLVMAKQDLNAPAPEVVLMTQYPIASGGQEAVVAMPASVLPAVKNIEAQIAIIGSYEAQKNFINRLYSLNMLKQVTSFSLTGSKVGDVLEGNIIAQFNFIPEAKINKDYNNPIFSQNSFDFGSVSTLRALLSQKTGEVVIGGAGRNNPFLP